MANKSLLTEEERERAFTEFMSCQVVDIKKVSLDEYMCQAQDKKTLQEVAKWLEGGCGMRDLEVLKRGELPNGN